MWCSLSILSLFFCALRKTTGVISIGPFARLPSEIQKIAVSLVFYCAEIPKTFLRSLALCTSLSGVSLEISRLIIQVVGEVHRDGRLDLGSYLSFLISCAFAAPNRESPPYYDILSRKAGDKNEMSSSKRHVVKCVCDAIRFHNRNSKSCMQDLLAPSLDRTLSSVSSDMHPRTAEIAMSLAAASFHEKGNEDSKFGTWLPRHIISCSTSVDLQTECVRACPSLLLSALSSLDTENHPIEPLIALMASDRLLTVWRDHPGMESALMDFYRNLTTNTSTMTTNSPIISKFRVEFRMLYNKDL